MLEPSQHFQDSSPQMSLNADRVNRSLGLLEQATGVSRGSLRTPAQSSRSGTQEPSLQQKMDQSFLSPMQPLRSFALEDSSVYEASPQRQMLFTPSGKLSASLMETSHNLRQRSILTTPGHTASGAVEQSLMLTPQGPLDETKFDKFNFLVEADPGVAATEGLYEEFYHSFKTHQSSHEVFILVQKYEELCQEQVDLLSKLTRRAIPGQHKFEKTRQVLHQLEHEKCTWRLLASLYQDRQMTSEGMDDKELDTQPSYKNKSDKDIVNTLYENDASVRQAQIIVDWLESCAADQLQSQDERVEYFSQSVCWENSLHNMQQKVGGGVPLPRNHVTSLDPDAPIRENKQLADLDKEDEVRLLKDIFICIRSGQMEEAQRLCKKCSQSWRAATLEGWRLYHDPNISNDTGHEPIEGNHFRDVWKKVCWRMAEDERFHLYERATYAALSGNLKELLPACNSWSDYLWAYFKVMVDQKVEQTLRDHLILSRPLEALPPNFDQKMLTVPNIFHELQATPHKNVETEAKFKLHIVQKYMILDELDVLTEEMAEWLNRSDGGESVSSHLIRFMAHFILTIRSLGLQTREETTVRIIEEFVKDLIASNRTELVAIYVAQLPPSLQVAYYAKFLEGISEQEDQQRCLQLAEDAGLDVAAITKAVVENICTGSDDVITELIARDSLEAVTTEEDQKKIDAITWLVFDPSQRSEALKQSNALIRTFLELKKHNAAHEVFQKVPQDSIDTIMRNWQATAGSVPLRPDDANAIREHLCIKAYLDALNAFNDWFDHYHNKKPNRPICPPNASFHDKVRFEHEEREFKMELHKWDQTLSILTKGFSDTAYNVLLFVDGGWMVDQQESLEEDKMRQEQLVRLRSRCIPSLFTLLHTVLHTRGMFRECLTLADEIASEEFQLYKVFTKPELRQFLSRLRESSVQLLDQGLDALGYEI